MQADSYLEGRWATKGHLSADSEYRSDIYRLVDVFVLSSGFALAHFWRFGDFTFEPSSLVVALLFILGFNITGSAVGLYTRLHDKRLIKTFGTIIYSAVCALGLISLILVFTHTSETFSRVWYTLGIFTGIFLVLAYRFIIFELLRSGLIKLNAQRTVIVGSGELGQEVASRVFADELSRSKIIGFFDDSSAESVVLANSGDSLPLLGTPDEVESVLENLRFSGNAIDRIFVALPASDVERKIKLVERLITTPYKTFVVPDYSLKFLASCRPDDLAGLPVIDVSHSKLQGARATVKTTFDVVASGIALLVLSPLFFVVAILIKLDTHGPVFFSQRRYGNGGREFRAWKFRSMSVTEDGDNIKQAQKNDCRVTRVGKVLRSTSIDELPQLFNVINGTMSLVGPRPHAVAHNEAYRKLIDEYMTRHSVKPGITGWAQINGCRGETVNLEDMKKRVEFDRDYMRRWSVGLDVYIVMKTVIQIVKGDGAY